MRGLSGAGVWGAIQLSARLMKLCFYAQGFAVQGRSWGGESDYAAALGDEGPEGTGLHVGTYATVTLRGFVIKEPEATWGAEVCYDVVRGLPRDEA